MRTWLARTVAAVVACVIMAGCGPVAVKQGAQEAAEAGARRAATQLAEKEVRDDAAKQAAKVSARDEAERLAAGKPLGRGRTGQDPDPKNLQEKLAVDDVLANPADGKPLPFDMADTRWAASDGWVKMEKMSPGGIIVHWVYNPKMNGPKHGFDDVKVKRN